MTNDLHLVAGDLEASGMSFGVAAAVFNRTIVDAMLDGALRTFARANVEKQAITVVRVPGAWEIPAALKLLAEQRDLDGLVALGAVIRGETPHFDFVCQGCTQGCMEVGLRYGIPVGFGLLTCDSTEQASARAGGKGGNKGEEAAEAAIRMARTAILLDADRDQG